MRLRTTHPSFTQAVNVYFDKLIPKLVPLQVEFTASLTSCKMSSSYPSACCVFQFKKGGPIIAVQVENEYGSFAKDQSYMLFIKEVKFLTVLCWNCAETFKAE